MAFIIIFMSIILLQKEQSAPTSTPQTAYQDDQTYLNTISLSLFTCYAFTYILVYFT